MRYFTLIKDEGTCIEVCASEGLLDGALLGYAIRFAGSWDGWRVERPLHTLMRKVAIGLETADQAIAEIVGAACTESAPSGITLKDLEADDGGEDG